MSTRIEREKQTVGIMVSLYCKKHHPQQGDAGHSLCPQCQELLNYAYLRLNRCKFGNNKKACQHCPVHCYKPTMRQQMREVMRYAGPRMLWHHPIIALRHLIGKG